MRMNQDDASQGEAFRENAALDLECFTGWAGTRNFFPCRTSSHACASLLALKTRSKAIAEVGCSIYVRSMADDTQAPCGANVSDGRGGVHGCETEEQAAGTP